MPRPAARFGDPVTHVNPPTLSSPGPGSPDVIIDHKKAWRGVDAAAASALQAAKKTSDAAVDLTIEARKTAEKAVLAASAPPTPALAGAQATEKAAKAAEQLAKATALSTLSTMVNSMAMGADIHLCRVPSPSPPHGPGVVVDGSDTVFINGKPACRKGDTVVEPLGPPNKIKDGCPTVFIGEGSRTISIPSPPAAAPAPPPAAAPPPPSPVAPTPPPVAPPPPAAPVATPPVAAAPAAGTRVIRQDHDFTDPNNQKGKPKSRLDANGDLAPNDPAGACTPLNHVIGSAPAKDNTPYTSLMTEEAGSVGKAYGPQEIEVDMPRLQADIASGALPGVEVITPAQLQKIIRDDIERLAPGFDPDAALADPKGLSEHVKGKSLSKSATDKVERRLIALSNTTRDQEFLVKGVIPSDYFRGPYAR